MVESLAGGTDSLEWPAGPHLRQAQPHSLSHIYWPIAAQDERQISRLLLTGLTTEQAGAIAPRARSWLSPPRAVISGEGTARYDPAERAYVIEGVSGRDPSALTSRPILTPVGQSRVCSSALEHHGERRS